MKRNVQLFFSIMILHLLFATACTKKELAHADAVKDLTDTKNFQLRIGGDGAYDVLGHGYDVTGEYANASSAGFAVLDIQKIKNENPTILISENARTQEYLEEYAEDGVQYSSKISNKVTVTTGFSVFSASISNFFSSSESFNSKYIYGSYNLTIKQKRVRLNAINDTLINYLSANFKSALQTMTAQQLVANYGTHLLLDIYTGAKMEIIYQSETTNQSRETAARAGIKAGVSTIFGIDISNDIDKNEARQNFSKKLSYRTRGGDPTIGLVGEINLDQNTPKINIANWQSSATPANSVLVDFGPNGLVLLYDLIKDINKRAEVKSYVDKYISDHQAKLIYQRVPIVSYVAQGTGGHYFTPLNVPQISGPGYVFNREGVAFYAHNRPVPGGVPIYVYRSLTSDDHYYTTLNVPQISGPGYLYSREGVIFYAYGTPSIGTVPLYSYQEVSSGQHYLSTDNIPQIIGPGYVFNNEGVLFHVFKTGN